MTLLDTGKAIGAITSLLRDRLSRLLSVDIAVGRPESASKAAAPHPRLNLFLYEVHFDEYLANVPLRQDQQSPLWLVLRYLLTPFDPSGESDTIEAHEILGSAIQALQGLNFISMSQSNNIALVDNPEDLKITFTESSHDLLGNIMQGSEERYRLSVSFEVRPVMIANPLPPSYSLLVGIDNTSQPVNIIGESGIDIQVLPSIAELLEGSSITSITPTTFEQSSTLVISGKRLDLSDLQIKMENIPLDIKPSSKPTSTRIECIIPDGKPISPGSKPIYIIQKLANGKERSSNILIGNLLPTLDTAVIKNVKKVGEDNASKQPLLKVTITLKGSHLGGEHDDISIALYKEGKTVKLLDDFKSNPSNTELEFSMDKDPGTIYPGKYRIILITNGQQARNSPQLEVVAP